MYSSKLDDNTCIMGNSESKKDDDNKDRSNSVLSDISTYASQQLDVLLKPKDLIYDVPKIYWDQDGNLRYGQSSRVREQEVLSILQADDSDESDETKVWMIVPSRWIKKWLLFAHLKLTGEEPGPIDMMSLLVQEVVGGEVKYRPKSTLEPPNFKVDAINPESPGHYRRISLEAWSKLSSLYGVDGYAIAVRGVPYDDKSRWRVFKNIRLIDIKELPEPIIKPKETVEKKEKKGIFS